MLTNKRFRIGSLSAALILVLGCTPAPNTGMATPAAEYFPGEGSGLPFSPAVRVGDILYLSGQIGMRADGTFPDGIEAQTHQAMENIAAALSKAGSSMDAVFKCTAMLEDMSAWPDFNKAYIGYFTPGRLPARSSFGADGLALGALVEIECMALAASPPAGG